MSLRDEILRLRPSHVVNKLGSQNKVCLLNGRDVYEALKDEKVIIMACNPRIKLVIPGLMRAAEEQDAVVIFELARTEGGLDGGYTGQDPETFFRNVVGYAEERGFTKPFIIHADHTTVKDTSAGEVEGARQLLAAQIKTGYTSFSIDASFNPLETNIKITSDLARPIMEAGLGLEVEVGEIKHTGTEGTITTVDEAITFIKALTERGIKPNLLAINNGAKHGNYLEGEKIFIDLDRTGEIYRAIKTYGVCIAQHGITGTPLSIVGRFADYGIRKGNVATEFQNIVHQSLPKDLEDRIQAWMKENKKDIKFASKQFKPEIEGVSTEVKKQVEEKAYQSAVSYIKAFRAEGTASKLAERLKKKVHS